MKDKEIYCPLYNGSITQNDCDELCFGANFNHLASDGEPHLMSIESIRKNRIICVRCQVKKNKSFSSNAKIIQRVEELEEKYKDDDEALEVIERSKADITYLEKKAFAGNHDGQTPEQYLLSLERHLFSWY